MEVLQGYFSNSKVYLDRDSFLWLLNRARYYHCWDKKCFARCVGSVENGVLSLNPKHNHQPNYGLIDELRFKAMLRSLSASTNRSLLSIYGECQQVHVQGALRAGDFSEVVDLMKRARRAVTPSVPKSIAEFGKLMRENSR